MNSNLRSNIILTKTEEYVLKSIVQGRTTIDIVQALKSSRGVINSVRASLKEKFGAKSDIHLIVLAILEKKYFLLLGDINYSPRELEDRERDTLILSLKGYTNPEIANEFGISRRTIVNVKTKLAIAGKPGLVKRAIELGILIIFPVIYRMETIEVFGQETRVYKLNRRRVTQRLKFSNINHTGFIYVDYLNRFTFTQTSIFRSNELYMASLVTSVKLSGYDDLVIQNLIDSETESVQDALNRVNANINFIPLNEYLRCCILFKNIEINSRPAHYPSAFILGQRLILKYLAEGLTDEEVMRRTKMSKSVFKEQLKILKIVWSSNSILSIYVTFLHLNYLQLENNS